MFRTLFRVLISLGAVFCAAGGADAQTDIDRLRVQNGPYAGGYTVMLNDTRLNWYFCNLGLLPVASTKPNAVRNYLDLYLKYADRKTGTIDDFDIKTRRPTTSDSDDAYAATFLSLAVRYYEASGDKKWWAANIDQIKQIAKQVLVAEQKPGGLVNTFVANRSFANDPTKKKKDYQRVGQLMDNCEVFRGLSDLARALKDDPDAKTFRDCAADVAKGIDALFDTDKKAFRPNDAADVADGPFYPYRAAQAFPELYDVPLADQKKKYDAAWAYLNGRPTDNWSAGKYGKDKSTGGFPWMTLGYAAAKRGGKPEVQLAQSQLRFFQTEAARKPVAAPFTSISELGFVLRLEQQLAK